MRQLEDVSIFIYTFTPEMVINLIDCILADNEEIEALKRSSENEKTKSAHTISDWRRRFRHRGNKIKSLKSKIMRLEKEAG